MRILRLSVEGLGYINATVLRLTRTAAWLLLVVMVVVILLQVVFRYGFNNALPWPEEAARSMMIWMMALIAPSAYRWGGFVSIDLLKDLLPARLSSLLNLILLLLAAAVLWILLNQAMAHFRSGFLFTATGLKIKLAWIYLAMSVCFGLMLSVNLELSLREVGRLIGRPEDFPQPVTDAALSSE
ncbi:TRAP transporter small permease subunit [Stappia sp.]|uniref:TRAP transporter small permease n=1 Tax=Stappia sp. TaxID=1870903 RepID=UPI0032D98CCF